VAEAENGRHALSKLQDGLSVDVILTDMNMPEMTGMELLKHVQQCPLADVKVVVLSSADHDLYRTEAIACGASGYLLKHNVNYHEIITTITDVAVGYKSECRKARTTIDGLCQSTSKQ
jgi:two-component system response regulator YesN